MLSEEAQQNLRKTHLRHDLRVYGYTRTAGWIILDGPSPGQYTWDGEQDGYKIDAEDFVVSEIECRTCNYDFTMAESAAIAHPMDNRLEDSARFIEHVARFWHPESRRETLAAFLQGLQYLPPEDFAWLKDLVNGLELVSLLDSKPTD